MKNTIKSKTWENPPVALPITEAELLGFGLTHSEIAAGEARGQMKTFGPWQIPVNYRALCMSTVYGEAIGLSRKRESETVYGIRTLCNVRALGYSLEGRVSVNGKTVRGFTSSQLFELPDGRLLNVATIHACTN